MQNFNCLNATMNFKDEDAILGGWGEFFPVGKFRIKYLVYDQIDEKIVEMVYYFLSQAMQKKRNNRG